MNEWIPQIQEIIKVLRELGVEPFLWAGTLLGAVREKDFITDDSDIDLAYISNYHTPAKIKKECINLYKGLDKRGLLHNYFDENWQVHTPENISTVFGQAHIREEAPYYDLFTMWTSGGKLYDPWFGPIFEDKHEVVKDLVELRGVKFPGLTNQEEILSTLYGDWKTPRKEKGTKYHKFKYALKSFK